MNASDADFKVFIFLQVLNSGGIELLASDFIIFDQGVYRQNVSTTIKTDNIDRDIAITFPLDITKHNDPRKIKKSAKNAIEIKNRRTPRIKEPCVTVEYQKEGNTHTHIDLALYAIKDEQYYLARGKENSDSYEWEEADPKGLNDLFDDWFSGSAGDQFRRIVRYLKKWKLEQYPDSTSKDQIPPGIGLTLLAHDGFSFSQEGGQDDDFHALYVVVKKMKDSFGSKIDNPGQCVHFIHKNLPVLPSSDIFSKLTDIGQENFYTKVSKFEQLLADAKTTVEDYEAAKILRKIWFIRLSVVQQYLMESMCSFRQGIPSSPK